MRKERERETEFLITATKRFIVLKEMNVFEYRD